jgi:ferredoxin
MAAETAGKPDSTVVFRNFRLAAPRGGGMLDVLLDGHAPITYLCMGGTCGTCRVRVRSGMEHLEPRNEAEDYHRLKSDERLACQSIFTGTGDVVVEQD